MITTPQDGTAPERAAEVRRSARGEWEITSPLESNLDDGLLRVERIGRGYAWLDTGTHRSLLEVGCPEEIAWQQGWIGDAALAERGADFNKTAYGQNPTRRLEEGRTP